MHPDIETRFENLEIRRQSIVGRVRDLPPDRRTAKANNKGFSPVEVIMHLALAEQGNVEMMRKAPPSSLKGKKPHVTSFFNKIVNAMQRPDHPVRSTPGMTPRGDVTLEKAERLWEQSRTETRKYLETVPGLREPFIRFNLLMGLASVNDYLTLLEAHMTYHEQRFPAV
ncbi:MAG TPA: hypothetical protein VG944_06200 [Fimbriimonas sp.]|nr:hypothetical protein [Fimbriimonas sp.]